MKKNGFVGECIKAQSLQTCLIFKLFKKLTHSFILRPPPPNPYANEWKIEIIEFALHVTCSPN